MDFDRLGFAFVLLSATTCIADSAHFMSNSFALNRLVNTSDGHASGCPGSVHACQWLWTHGEPLGTKPTNQRGNDEETSVVGCSEDEVGESFVDHLGSKLVDAPRDLRLFKWVVGSRGETCRHCFIAAASQGRSRRVCSSLGTSPRSVHAVTGESYTL